METNILKFELTASRYLDDSTPDTITASIGIPVEANDEAVNEAMNSDELIAYAVSVLYDLAAYMRPQWLDGEEEMADVMEVLYAMGKTCAVSKREVEQVRSQKAAEK